MDKKIYFEQKQAAARKIPFDVLLKNVKIINVFTLEVIEGCIGIKHGGIVSFDEHEADVVIEGNGRYVSPLYIDAHMHIESTLVQPSILSDVLLARGVGTVVADPHELVNACGKAGLDYLLEATEDLRLRVLVSVPSCVPATSFETNKGAFLAKEIVPYYKHPRIISLAEVMSARDVFESEEMFDKLFDAKSFGKIIDGHGSVLDSIGLDVYATMNIKNDHECDNVDKMLDRMRRGMHVFIREGSAAQNLEALLPGINRYNYQMAAFCTDDRHIDDLLEKGSIDYIVHKAIMLGCTPILAIAMATINAARAYKLENIGALAPGYEASFFLFENLQDIRPQEVYHKGVLVAKEYTIIKKEKENKEVYRNIEGSFHVKPYMKESLRIHCKSGIANIIQILPYSLVTNHLMEKIEVNDRGEWIPQENSMKIAVVERYHQTGNIGLGLVKDFYLKGAIATSVAHDSHNIIGIGQNDEDLYLALQTIDQQQGGYCVVVEGKVVANLALSVAGLLSTDCLENVVKDLKELHKVTSTLLQQKSIHPFMLLSFLALPVIPSLKITDLGLFDVENEKIISIEVEKN